MEALSGSDLTGVFTEMSSRSSSSSKKLLDLEFEERSAAEVAAGGGRGAEVTVCVSASSNGLAPFSTAKQPSNDSISNENKYLTRFNCSNPSWA